MKFREGISRKAYSIGRRFFQREELKQAWQKINNNEIAIEGIAQHAAYVGLRIAKITGIIEPILRHHVSIESIISTRQHGERTFFDEHYLHLKLNRIYDLPEVVVDPGRPHTINVLVPAFDFRSISAGFFGVFQFARFLRSTGRNVRLVLFDNFYFDIDAFRQKFLAYPGMENLLDELEIEYIGERKHPLLISEGDTCVATVWYSAHFAKKIMNTIKGGKFIYLIQDYESNFFSGSTLFCLADETYKFDYIAVFSTEALQEFFLKNDIGSIKGRDLPYIFFENASASNLSEWSEFEKLNRRKTRKRIVFYSRPVVDRNMFELTALVLIESFKRGIFSADEWECIGMGLGEATIELAPGVRSMSLPRMTLAEYVDAVAGFDICLTLMASPHPSLIPMDLAGSGAVVVTNTFETKTPEYLTSISGNIIPCAPNLEELVAGLAEAKRRSESLEERYENARAMTYPREWSQSLTDRHAEFIRRQLGGSPNTKRPRSQKTSNEV